MDELLSTQEAARLAGVGPTSVKRWADEGLLPCRKTAGGHRRFERGELDRFLREQAGEQPRQSQWTDLLVSANSYAILGALYEARGRLGAWYRVADELAPAITELGVRWVCGTVSVLQEHVASERLSRALAHVSDTLSAASEAPTCLLACAEGDEHTLGLSLAELCLREIGWDTVWAGARTPVADIVSAVESGAYRMLALSASTLTSDARALSRQAQRVANACSAAGIPLALGGNGAWPADCSGAERFSSFEPFHAFARTSARQA